MDIFVKSYIDDFHYMSNEMSAWNPNIHMIYFDMK